MRNRNLDFVAPLAPQQWKLMTRRAERLGPDQSGLGWDPEHPDRIRVFVRPSDAPPGFERYVTRGDRYGDREREVAIFVYNDGNPYAELHEPDEPEPPAISEQQHAAMEEQLADWVRNKWHELMKNAGAT